MMLVFSKTAGDGLHRSIASDPVEARTGGAGAATAKNIDLFHLRDVVEYGSQHQDYIYTWPRNAAIRTHLCLNSSQALGIGPHSTTPTVA